VLAVVAGRVTIPADGDRAGQQLAQLRLDGFRARAEVPDAPAAADRAGGGDALAEAAVMAAQRLTALVVGQGHITARAGGHVAAIPAEHVAGRAPPVEEQDGLLPARIDRL